MPDIVHRVGIAAEPMRVFQALTTVEGIRAWWSDDTHGEASEGRAFQFRSHRFGVIHADPSLIKWSYSGPVEDWVGTEIQFRLEWRDNQTFVVFDHKGWREANDMMHHCSTKWATFLLSLKDLVETGEGRPKPHDTLIEVGA